MLEGTSFGPYEIRELLGAGGMGEVYRARDPRLDREVAVKVLPAEFADDPERLARFEQEARSAAALNHPNIAAVFDIGAEGHTRYFVQEYLRGADLRQRLEGGAVPLARSLRLAAGIARGLSAAHRAAVVHRDLKPENVFLTEQGEPKILDFGLAKPSRQTGSAEAPPDAPTQLQTADDVVVGTPGYMAPEQIEGRPVDERTDLFAFGCLLYEMVSGVRAFSGDSAIQTMNRIVHEQPRPLREVAAAPSELQRIVGKCLAKDPRRRYQTAADLVIDLEALTARVDSGEMVPGAEGREGGRGARRSPDGLSAARAAVLAVVAVIAGLVIGWWALGERPRQAYVSQVNLVERLVPRNDPGVAISPDGRTVVFVGADDGGNESLFMRRLDDPLARVIEGTAKAHSPTFSPDGLWVAYFDDSDRSLRKAHVSSGEIVVLSKSTGGHLGATWTDDGAVIFSSFQGGLGKVADDGSGEPRLLASPEHRRQGYRFPRFLPGTGDVLVTVEEPGSEPGTENTYIARVDGSDGSVQELLAAASDPRYLDPGYLLFRRQGDLHVIGFDPVERAPIGLSAVLRRGVASTADGPLFYDVARSGALVLLRREDYPVRGEATVVKVDRSGQESPLTDEPQPYSGLRVDPTGRRLAIQSGLPTTTTTTVLLYDLEAGQSAPLAAQDLFTPVWTRDGEWVLVSDMPMPGVWGFTMHRADLSGEKRQVPVPQETPGPRPVDFGSDDGVFLVQSASNLEEIWAVSVGEERPAELVASGRAMLLPALSPDGRWLAYTTLEAGESKVYVLEVSTGRRWPVSRTGGNFARWRQDGRELFYWLDDGLYAVPVRPGDSGWESGPGELLFAGRYILETADWTAWDAAPDGRSFFLLRDDGPRGWQPARLELILNSALLAERVLAADPR